LICTGPCSRIAPSSATHLVLLVKVVVVWVTVYEVDSPPTSDVDVVEWLAP
jgi:hypothetical protein